MYQVNAKAWRAAFSSGSSSAEYVVPGFASASPTLLMANCFGEQAVASRTTPAMRIAAAMANLVIESTDTPKYD